jgi:hypothetical protein
MSVHTYGTNASSSRQLLDLDLDLDQLRRRAGGKRRGHDERNLSIRNAARPALIKIEFAYVVAPSPCLLLTPVLIVV